MIAHFLLKNKNTQGRGKSTDEVSSATYNVKLVGVGTEVEIKRGAFHILFYEGRQRLLTIGEKCSTECMPALAQPHNHTL